MHHIDQKSVGKGKNKDNEQEVEIFELHSEEEHQRLKANLDSHHSHKGSFSINVAGDYCKLIKRQKKKKRKETSPYSRPLAWSKTQICRGFHIIHRKDVMCL